MSSKNAQRREQSVYRQVPAGKGRARLGTAKDRLSTIIYARCPFWPTPDNAGHTTESLELSRSTAAAPPLRRYPTAISSDMRRKAACWR